MLRTALLATLLAATPAAADLYGDLLAPGGFANPYQLTPNGSGGYELKPQLLDPGSLNRNWQPGGYMNPLQLQPLPGGGYEVRPLLPFNPFSR